MRGNVITDFTRIGKIPLGGKDGIFGPDISYPTFWAPFSDPDNPLYTEVGGPLTMVRATTATFLNPKTSLIESAANNILRIESEGALIEGQRTNLCLQSQTLGTTWVPTNITVRDNDTVSPDGDVNAELLTATAGNGTLIQDLGVVAAAVKTFSIYLKRKTGTGNIQLTLDGGTAWTIVAVTSEWTRFEVPQNVTDPDVGIRIVTSGDAVWAWGGQLEDSSAFASSYIPTVAASVTRNEDVLTFPVSGNIDAIVGTLCFKGTIKTTGLTRFLAGGSFSIFNNSTILRSVDGTSSVDSDHTLVSDAVTNIAFKWGTGGRRFAVDGVLDAAAGAFDGNLSIGATVTIGSQAGAQHAYGHMQNLRILPEEITDVQLTNCSRD
jgi:hypothetical protein